MLRLLLGHLGNLMRRQVRFEAAEAVNCFRVLTVFVLGLAGPSPPFSAVYSWGFGLGELWATW